MKNKWWTFANKASNVMFSYFTDTKVCLPLVQNGVRGECSYADAAAGSGEEALVGVV